MSPSVLWLARPRVPRLERWRFFRTAAPGLADRFDGILLLLEDILHLVNADKTFVVLHADLFRGKIFGSVFAVLALALSGFFLYGIFIGARHVLPPSHGAPHVGQTAPDFTLPDSQNHPVSLTGALNSPFTPESTTGAATNAAKAAGVILIFYRGYW